LRAASYSLVARFSWFFSAPPPSSTSPPRPWPVFDLRGRADALRVVYRAGRMPSAKVLCITCI
jgi:hypothetical protein